MIQSDFNTVGELVALAEAQHVPVHEIVLKREMHDRERSRGEVLQEMLKNWQVMQESIVRGIQNTLAHGIALFFGLFWTGHTRSLLLFTVYNLYTVNRICQ